MDATRLWKSWRPLVENYQIRYTPMNGAIIEKKKEVVRPSGRF